MIYLGQPRVRFGKDSHKVADTETVSYIMVQGLYPKNFADRPDRSDQKIAAIDRVRDP
jgi:hypothetical protein